MPVKKSCALQKVYSRFGEDKMRFIVLEENKCVCVRDKLRLWKTEYVIMMTHYANGESRTRNPWITNPVL